MSFATPNVGADKYTGYSYEGKPIVVAKKRGGSLKQAHHKNNWQPEEKRIEVATMWAVLRDMQQVSDLTGVSAGVIKKWKDEPWFHNVVSRVVKDKNDVLDKKLTDVIDSCADLIQNRLNVGDPRVNYKTGEVYTVPLDARGLAMVLGILFDKRQLVRGEATSRTETVSFDRRLENLKETFERFSQATQIEGVYTKNDDIQQEKPQRRQTEAERTPLLMGLGATTMAQDATEVEGEGVVEGSGEINVSDNPRV